MGTETVAAPTFLKIAWTRYAQLDAVSSRRLRAYSQLRIWIIILGVLVVLLAIVTASFFSDRTTLAGFVLKILLVGTPVIASLLAAFGTKAFRSGDWLTTRAAAEEYRKEIYFYRTVLRYQKSRETYLERRIDEIQRQLYVALGGERKFKPYKATIPPHYDPADPNSDPGFNDLNGDAYFTYRLDDQLRWHIRKANDYKWERNVVTTSVVVAGAFGALLAAIGGFVGVWVALTTSIMAALLAFQQLRNLDLVIKNYSKVILELSSVHDHWTNLEPDERTDSEFYKMVNDCEGVLWGQNSEYIKVMREALNASDLEQEASLVNRVIKESVEAAERTKQMMRDTLVESAQEVLQAAEEKVEEVFKAAVGALAEEASSEIVQRELEAMMNTAAEQVAFTAYHPKEGKPLVWHPLLVYIHTVSAFGTVRQDVVRFMDQIKVPKEITHTSTTQLSRGTEITILPSCEGITFNPERITVKWLEDYQRADFRFSAAESLLDDAAKGRIDFFVGPLIVGSLKFAMLFNNGEEQSRPDKEEYSKMYRKDAIFVSYSHNDTKIVEAFKLVHQATGYDVLIDIDNLRSGQEWNPALMRMIDSADIFQLFWSQNSSQSIYCQQEWQYALKRNQEGFIRPVYWQLPLPDPPDELSKYHFEYVPLEEE